MKCLNCRKIEAQENDCLCIECDKTFGTYGLSRIEKMNKRMKKTAFLLEELKQERLKFKKKINIKKRKDDR